MKFILYFVDTVCITVQIRAFTFRGANSWLARGQSMFLWGSVRLFQVVGGLQYQSLINLNIHVSYTFSFYSTYSCTRFKCSYYAKSFQLLHADCNQTLQTGSVSSTKKKKCQLFVLSHSCPLVIQGVIVTCKNTRNLQCSKKRDTPTTFPFHFNSFLFLVYSRLLGFNQNVSTLFNCLLQIFSKSLDSY